MSQRPLLGKIVRRVKAELVLHGAGVRDVAELSDISYDRVRSVLAGRKSPRPGELEKIGEALAQLRRGEP